MRTHTHTTDDGKRITFRTRGRVRIDYPDLARDGTKTRYRVRQYARDDVTVEADTTMVRETRESGDPLIAAPAGGR